MEQRIPGQNLRKKIEARILSIAPSVEINGSVDCFNEDIVQDFFAAWRDLVQYYRDNDDMDIGVEVIREYITYSDMFGGMEYNPNLSDQCHESADEAYKELKAYLDDIVLLVTRRWHPGGR